MFHTSRDCAACHTLLLPTASQRNLLGISRGAEAVWAANLNMFVYFIFFILFMLPHKQ